MIQIAIIPPPLYIKTTMKTYYDGIYCLSDAKDYMHKTLFGHRRMYYGKIHGASLDSILERLSLY